MHPAGDSAGFSRNCSRWGGYCFDECSLLRQVIFAIWRICHFPGNCILVNEGDLSSSGVWGVRTLKMNNHCIPLNISFDGFIQRIYSISLLSYSYMATQQMLPLLR